MNSHYFPDRFNLSKFVMLKSLTNFLSEFFYGKGCTEFSLAEQCVLHATCELLPEPYKAKALAQIETYNYIQRLSQGKSVNMYQVRLLQIVELDPNLSLLGNIEKYCLAKIVLGSLVNEEVVEAGVWVIEGQLFSIHFNKPPELLGENFAAVQSQLLADLVSGMVQSIQQSIESRLPESYLNLVDSGVRQVNGWQLLHSSDLYEVVYEECNYFVLAKKENVGLVVANTDLPSALAFVSFNDDEILPITETFHNYLKQA